jgi:hypothetical protein
VCLAVGVVIYIIAMSTLNVGARYFAMMLTPLSNVVPQLFIYNTLSLHVARPYPKRAAGLALINAIGGTSNIWGSYVWYEPPHFYAGFGMGAYFEGLGKPFPANNSVLAVTVIFGTTITLYKFWVIKQNKMLDAGGEQAKRAARWGITQEQLDLGWRYVGY